MGYWQNYGAFLWTDLDQDQDLSGSWCIKGIDESTLITDSSIPSINYDPSDLGSLILIQIIPKEGYKIVITIFLSTSPPGQCIIKSFRLLLRFFFLSSATKTTFQSP